MAGFFCDLFCASCVRSPCISAAVDQAESCLTRWAHMCDSRVDFGWYADLVAAVTIYGICFMHVAQFDSWIAHVAPNRA